LRVLTAATVAALAFMLLASTPEQSFSRSPHAALAPATFQNSTVLLPFQLSSGLDTTATNLGLALMLPRLVNSMLAVYPVLDETWIEQYQRTIFPTEKALRDWVAAKTPFPKEDLDATSRDRYVLMGTVKSDKSDKGKYSIDLTLLDRQTGTQSLENVVLDVPSLVDFQNGVIRLLEKAGLGVTAAEKARMVWREDISKAALEAVCKQYYYAMRLDYNTTTPEQYVKFAKEAVATAQKSYTALVDYGNALMMANYARNMDQAKKQFEQAVALHQNGYLAATGLYNIALAQDDPDALKTWAIRRSTMQNKSGDATLAEFYAAQAKSAATRRNYGRAAELYLKAQEFANIPLYTRNMARMLALAGNVNKAEQVLRAGMQNASNDRDKAEFRRGLAEIWSDRADVFADRFASTRSESDLGAAIASYKRSMDELLTPSVAANYVYYHTELSLLTPTQLSDTLQTLTQRVLERITTKPERVRFSLDLARLLNLYATATTARADTARYQTAETALRRAAALDGEDFTYPFNLLDVLLNHETNQINPTRLTDASTLITNASRIWSADKPKMALLANWRGILLRQQGKFDEAIEASRQGVAMSPDSYPCLEGLGASCVAAKRFAEAIPPLERRVSKDSTSAEVFRLLGVSYFHLKNMTKSRTALQRSFALNSKGNSAVFDLAKVHAVQKEYAEAAKFLEISLQSRVASFKDVETDTAFDPIRSSAEYNVLKTKYRR
jgi:tetratricopeptide (TPR) repeat protein